MRDIQSEITDRIVSAIESGAADGKWQMPWHATATAGWPVNAVTHRPYRGVNVVILSLTSQASGYPTNEWASFQQWKERGASVRKGEHGAQIVFYRPLEVQSPDGDDDPRVIPMLRYSTVFNRAQVDNAPAEKTVERKDLTECLANADAFVAATGAVIHHAQGRAFYRPGDDWIGMPDRDAFKGSQTSNATEAYYGTLLHELTHWTAPEKRCGREFGKRFGDNAYAAEELVAEIGASFLCAQLGISAELRPDHVQYVASWLKILKADKRAIFTAAAKASAAVEFLAGLQPVLTEEAA